jgi:signal transduction histidine kinase
MDQEASGREAAGVETYFAPAARASDDALRRQIEIVSRNPIVDTLMRVVSGLLAVINRQRQILAVNDTLLDTLGLEGAASVLGLRPGEALDCMHADEGPGGCGTSRYCSSCGAAIAIVACLESGQAAERECAVTVEREGQEADLYFLVRSEPVEFDGERLVLLFLRDITVHQQRAALERIFYHDIGSIIGALRLNCHLLDSQPDEESARRLVARLANLTTRLAREVEIQRTMTQEGRDSYQLAIQEVSVEEVIQDLWDTFVHYPAAQGKVLLLPAEVPDYRFNTDISLLLRILTNMLINAFEATEEEGEVELGVDHTPDQVVFWVWNKGMIPEEVALHIFQRNFTTREGAGRGLGTYTIKLLGEEYLRGEASFSTSEAEGTVFRLSLPRKPFLEITSHAAV